MSPSQVRGSSATGQVFTVLNNYRKRKEMRVFYKGLLIAASLFFAVLFLLAVTEAQMYLSTGARTVIMSVFAVFCAVLFIWFFIVPLLRLNKNPDTAGYIALADEAGAALPHIKDELRNALELTLSGGSAGTSKELIEAAFASVSARVTEKQFIALISFAQLKKLARILLPAVVLLFGVQCALPALRNATGRLLLYSTEFYKPQKFYLLITPGNAKIKKGEQVILRVIAFPLNPGTVTLYLKDPSEINYRKTQLKLDSTGAALYTIPQLKTSLSYYASAEDINSEVYTLEAIEQPVVTSMSVTVQPPAYSKLQSVSLEDNGNIQTLKGSDFKLTLKSSKPLSRAVLVKNDSVVIPLQTAGATASLAMRLFEDFKYKVVITDTGGLSNADPIEYSVTLSQDAMPELTVLRPDGDVILSGDQRIGVFLKVKDDYGFSRLQLKYRLSASRYEPPVDTFSTLPLPLRKDVTEDEIAYIWNVQQLLPATEDVYTFYFELADNDIISGPKTVKSKMYTARVPSVNEMFKDVSEEQHEVEQDLNKTLKAAEDLKKELEQISKDLKQDKKELTWEEKDRIRKTMDKFEELQKKAEDMKSSLAETKDKMQQNNLLSKETLEKYMEMQKMFEQLSSDEFKKAMEKLRNSLQNMDRKQTQDALQNMKMDEDAFKKSIERTLNLLKRIQIEQKMDELVKRAENAGKEQEKTGEQTEKENADDTKKNDELAQRQEQVEEQIKDLEQQMKELSDKMKEMQDMPKEELDKLRKEFEKQDNDKMSRDAQKDIKKGNNRQAREKQKQIAKNMKQMQKSLKDMQNSMMRESQMQTLTDMMKAIDNLIKLSKDQEARMKDVASHDYLDNPRDEIRKQDELKQNLDKIAAQLAQLGQKTFAITPEMGKELGDARNKMDQAMSGMDMRNTQMAAGAQADAMKSLNKAATLLKGGMDAMMNGGSNGGGMMSLMQQLQKMSGQQMGLNNMTQQLQQMANGQLSPQQQAELQRLAQQQEMIKKSLDELNNEAKKGGKSKSLPGNLENIMKDMQEVITDMRTQKLDNELTQRQERILSRMLDAQRSSNERDFEKTRESNSGVNVTRNSPAERQRTAATRDKLKEELEKAVKEGLSRDYEELLRKYYELLQQQGVQR